MNFAILDKFVDQEIVFTDGFYLYKYEKEILSAKSTKFEFPLLAVEARSANNNELYHLNANGKITLCDTNFRNEQEVITHAAITKMIYLCDLDSLLLCDSFIGTTRLMYLENNEKKIRFVQRRYLKW